MIIENIQKQFILNSSVSFIKDLKTQMEKV